MQRHQWKKVQVSQKSQSHPIPRWGHTSCAVKDEILFFGGYADSHYMNDLWSYNINTLEWKQIKTSGSVPFNRSNCTMHYDEKNNRIVLFGGGGQNKKRFNSIHIMDLKSKQWLEINPKQNQAAPWQRTYHTAELVYPYLIVFGGQGVTDLNDLWIFNFLTFEWKQVAFDQSKPHPCSRRFHSSALINNKFYVIAGCHGKYKPLSDVYSLDLTNLLKTGKTDALEWKQQTLKNSSYLSRWGQSSTVFENKIYVFGGRFSSDLNDILIIDCEAEIIKPMKTGQQLPKPRRRHSASFIGSCLIIFGGFNGDYFNDLYYINVMDLKSKSQTRKTEEFEPIERLVGKCEFADHQIMTEKSEYFPLHKGLICQRFKDAKVMEQFLSEINSNHTKSSLKQLFQVLYSGKKSIPTEFKKICSKYDVKLDNSDQNYGVLRNTTNGNKNPKPVKNQICTKSDQQFMEFLEECRNPVFFDFLISINQYYHVPINSIKLIMTSSYFQNLVNYHQNQNKIMNLQLPIDSPIMFQTLINYLNTDQIVVPGDMCEQTWMELCIIADYFCLDKLVKICEKKLSTLCNKSNVQDIFVFSLKYDLKNLAQSCCDLLIRDYSTTILNEFQNFTNEILMLIPKKYHKDAMESLSQMYKTIVFDLKQISAKNNTLNSFKKKDSASTQGGEKENYQYNYND